MTSQTEPVCRWCATPAERRRMPRNATGTCGRCSRPFINKAPPDMTVTEAAQGGLALLGTSALVLAAAWGFYDGAYWLTQWIVRVWRHWIAVLLVTGALMLSPAAQARLSDPEAERWADAIWRIEGGARARKPYGVLSVPVRDAREARAVVRRSLHRRHDDWLAAGRPGYFVDYFADRWCPAATDPTGNARWKRNARKILNLP